MEDGNTAPLPPLPPQVCIRRSQAGLPALEGIKGPELAGFFLLCDSVSKSQHLGRNCTCSIGLPFSEQVTVQRR